MCSLTRREPLGLPLRRSNDLAPVRTRAPVRGVHLVRSELCCRRRETLLSTPWCDPTSVRSAGGTLCLEKFESMQGTNGRTAPPGFGFSGGGGHPTRGGGGATHRMPPLFAPSATAPPHASTASTYAPTSSLFSLPHPAMPRVASFNLLSGAGGPIPGGGEGSGGGGGGRSGGRSGHRGDGVGGGDDGSGGGCGSHGTHHRHPTASLDLGRYHHQHGTGTAPSPSTGGGPNHGGGGNTSHSHQLTLDAPAPRWHALSPGTDLNKPPAESQSAGGSVAPWQPYRLFPTHQPRRGEGPPVSPAPPPCVTTSPFMMGVFPYCVHPFAAWVCVHDITMISGVC